MIITFVTFMAGYLAIIGIPPFAGFWSEGRDHPRRVRAQLDYRRCCGILAAGVTGFYMTRMIAMTFFGKKRWEDDAHPHESPSVMTIPLVLLALGSVFSVALLFWGDIKDWLKPVVGYESVPTRLPTSFYIAVTLIVVIIGAVIGWVMYARRDVPSRHSHGSTSSRARHVRTSTATP